MTGVILWGLLGQGWTWIKQKRMMGKGREKMTKYSHERVCLVDGICKKMEINLEIP